MNCPHTQNLPEQGWICVECIMDVVKRKHDEALAKLAVSMVHLYADTPEQAEIAELERLYQL